MTYRQGRDSAILHGKSGESTSWGGSRSTLAQEAELAAQLFKNLQDPVQVRFGVGGHVRGADHAGAGWRRGGNDRVGEHAFVKKHFPEPERLLVGADADGDDGGGWQEIFDCRFKNGEGRM